jgi:hypothetical protein
MFFFYMVPMFDAIPAEYFSKTPQGREQRDRDREQRHLRDRSSPSLVDTELGDYTTLSYTGDD